MSEALAPDPRLLEALELEAAHLTFCGNAHAASRVWRIEAEAGVSYVKQASSRRKLHAERNALQHFAPLLGVRVPALLAWSERPPGLRMSQVEGAPLIATPPPVHVYAQAGQALARLHGAPLESTDPMSLDDAFEARFDAWYARGASRLPEDLAPRALRAWRARPRLARRRAPCHRDYSPRNWLWDGHSLGVIDFEHAGFDHPYVDLVRLWLDGRLTSPGERAFLSAWGEESAPRTAEFHTVALLHALCTAIWGLEHDDTEFAQAGLRALSELV